MATPRKRRKEPQAEDDQRNCQTSADSTNLTTHHSNSSSSGTESPQRSNSLFETEIPSNTEHWKQEHLDRIRVQVDLSVRLDPGELVARFSEKLLGPRYTEIKKKAMVRPLTYIQETLVQLMAAIRLNESSVNDIAQAKSNERQDLIISTKKEIEDWRIASLKNTDSEELKTIIHRTSAQALIFVEQLEYIVSCSYNERLPTEGMFQQLFLDFLKMFHLKAFGDPNIETANLQIGDSVNVISSADILVVHPGKPEKSLLAVIEVKRHENIHVDNTDCSPLITRTKVESPVSEELIGQHSGELLAYLPQSLFGHDGLFGIIVQGTKVCFTVIEAEKGYYEQLTTTGSPKQRARVHTSKVLNILSRSGRESLMFPLLEFLQIQFACCEI